MRIRRVVAAGAVAAATLMGGFTDGDEMLDVPVEGLPDYMLDAIPGSYVPLSIDDRAQFAWTETAQLWEPGRVLNVCFWGGRPAARAKIVKIADEWNRIGANIRLDFGNIDDPRLCNPMEQSEVRVSFTVPRYYSLVGKQSIVDVPMNHPSMNLYRFDYPTVTEKDFRRLILHEFGHALGLMHEHQRPEDGCDEEFDWDRVNRYMTGRPHYWTQPEVDKNLRPIQPVGALSKTPFDPASVMLYGYPAEFFKTGRESRCFVVPASEISEQDKSAVRSFYAENATEPRLAFLADALDASEGRERLAIETLLVGSDELLALRSEQAATGLAAPFEAAASTNQALSLHYFSQQVADDDAPESLHVQLLNRFSWLQSAPEAQVDISNGRQRTETVPVPATLRTEAVARAFQARATLRNAPVS